MFDTEMEMLPKDAYVKHVTEVLTEKQGRMTAAQADAQWCLDSLLISQTSCLRFRFKEKHEISSW